MDSGSIVNQVGVRSSSGEVESALKALPAGPVADAEQLADKGKRSFGG